MKNIIRRHYTILELLIVMAILIMIAGVVGYNIQGAIKDQRFRNEVKLIVDELRLAQDLMIILSTDVHVKFEIDPTGKGIKYWLETEEKLTKEWKPFIQRSHRNLQAIHYITFQELPSNMNQFNNLDLKFLSGGSVMSRGILILATSAALRDPTTLIRSICLKGYPHPIFSFFGIENTCGSDDENNYDRKLTEATVKEINENGKNKKEVREETETSATA